MKKNIQNTKMKKNVRKRKARRTPKSFYQIAAYVTEHVRQHKRFPTQKEISAGTGLAVPTISKSLAKADYRELCGNHVTRAGVDLLIEAAFQHALRGNSGMWDRYMEVAWDKLQKQQIEHGGEININLSNTIIGPTKRED